MSIESKLILLLFSPFLVFLLFTLIILFMEERYD